MTYRKFGKNDILINTLKANPRSEFYIYSSSVYYNNRSRNQGQYNGEAQMVPDGFVNLYEYNIDKGDSGVVYSSSDVTASGFFTGPGTNKFIEPYISKDSTRISLSMTTASLTSEEWGTRFEYGDKITGSYPQYASIRRTYSKNASSASSTNCNKANIDCNHNYTYMSLRSTLNNYGTLSEHFKVSSSYGNKDTQPLNIIQIPSIFYGNRIKPGTVSLRWYVTGSLLSEVTDSRLNGELIVSNKGTATGSAFSKPASKGTILSDKSGSVQGVILYNEGIIILTGNVPISQERTFGLDHLYDTRAESAQFPRWLYWGAGARDGVTDQTVRTDYRFCSFGLSFEGETSTETMTLYARAPRGQVNYSNNPTFTKYNQRLVEFTSSHIYQENKNRLLKNIVSSSYSDHEEKFRRQVYISKVGVYDEQKNLIGIATLADPVLKD